MAVKIQTVSICRCSFKWRNLLLGNQTLAYMYILPRPWRAIPFSSHLIQHILIANHLKKHRLSCTTPFSSTHAGKRPFICEQIRFTDVSCIQKKRSPIFMFPPPNNTCQHYGCLSTNILCHFFLKMLKLIDGQSKFVA